jgi:hypothetical protein
LLADDICTCEQIAQSKFGVVNDSERLARIVVSPRHFKKDGSVDPGVLPITHIEKIGLSLMRVDRMDKAELTKQAGVVAGAIDGGNVVNGVLVANALTVRHSNSGEREFCVFDDPVRETAKIPENEAHAAALLARPHVDSEIRRLRGLLLDRFSPVMPVSRVYKT